MAEKHALIPEPVAMYTQTETMKEVKDLSQNLVSGDFERQYKGGMADKYTKRRQAWFVTLAVAISAIVISLLVLTVIREIEILRLRQEVNDLTANMIAVSANVNSLNNKISNNKLFNEFESLDDAIYADDLDSVSTKDVKEKQKDEYLGKLHDLTELEDDSMPDDEDYDEDEDAESGDWYHDYDKRREPVGVTNMIKLRPEDFTDSVRFRKEDVMSNIRQIKRLLNENPENPDIAFPPSPPTTTEHTEAVRDKRHVFPDATSETIDKLTAPRIMSKTDDRRKTKKFLPTDAPASLVSTKVSPHTVVRTARNSDAEEGQRRPFVAAHFHGNTSHLNMEIHEHYKGNGLIRVDHGAHHNVWYPSPWTQASRHSRPTLTRNGHIHVHHTGVYLVYVQIYYLDSHDIVSWVLHRTNAEMEGRDTLLQCTQSSHSVEALEKANTCFSAAALFLRAGDRLAVRNTSGQRHSIMEPEKSFIGLVKLADTEDPDTDY
ncbi:protein eiger [Achroia grisella]|uniref:protein eiger n=1 Tax=Achroia grisella TaxID=688607 RepID=UPI0027D2FF79|nr:protein eiger [Achroia grisella]